ncbi:hypothetical protein OSH08_05350 [Kaistia geumhonensis]|uniref:Periplasmic protein-like protein n=1 Tax=Kaistia geumhonensis TaxID=410839 RepID=A0ABU0M5W7_9HYPH|nr:hypothetical protein [Kaistia geumhonensis]MCX5478418.1 hypothetical protein [Kaistia geumhonensis]MDQ0516364.1 hypothetical protein [Kaistia geumhonensis]
MRLAVFLVSLVIAAMLAGEARAGWVHIRYGENNSCIVSLTGSITLANANFFEAVTADCTSGGVLLESNGGLVEPALHIGELIRQRGLETAVAYDARCASACALIWLGGVKRNIFPSSRIGFHAAYVMDGDVARETGVGNALIGSYLTTMGLPRRSIIFITSADPKSVNWLDYRDAVDLGIGINLLGETDRAWIDDIRASDPHYTPL